MHSCLFCMECAVTIACGRVRGSTEASLALGKRRCCPRRQSLRQALQEELLCDKGSEGESKAWGGGAEEAGRREAGLRKPASAWLSGPERPLCRLC